MNRKTVVSIAMLSLVAVVLAIIGCSARTPFDPSVAARNSQSEASLDQLTSPGLSRSAAAKDLIDTESLPSRSEEIWVISKADDQQLTDATRDEIPGAGALMAKVAPDSQPVAVPLKHTDVKASIAGYIATVDVTQQYQNPYDGKIEAIYVFPLPHNAAVNEFVMTIGDRHIRGIIRERAEAEKIYQEAKSQGYVASLLTQERPNIFTQSVANIESGKAIDINIKYFHTLDYDDGWYEFVFPMVVGPRFNPPGSTDGVGAVGRGDGGKSGQTTEVQYLRPAERSGHDISLTVHVDAGVGIEAVESRNHRVAIKAIDETATDVTLAADDRVPNKDFVLRYKVAGKTVKSAILVQRDEKDPHGGGYFTLMVYPPDSLNDLPRQPLEMVFTLDVSGSMSGPPIEQSKAAIRYALTHMRPEDTFQIIRFAGGATRLSQSPLPATRDNVRHGLAFIESTDAGGGTMMIEGIRASLNFPHDESRLRFVSFLTDGYIGNEAQILGEVHKNLGPSRIFSFGVGSSPNRYLLDHLAKTGSGAVAYLGLSDKADDVMSAFFERISHPVLVDVSVDFGELKVDGVYPSRVPDLFVGRPIILTGRFSGDAPQRATIQISGKVGNENRQFEIPVVMNDQSVTHAGVRSVWARMKIAELADRASYQQIDDLALQIKNTALEYGLMSAYTAFVAVDTITRTSGDHGTTVAVPVPVPDGARYDTSVPE